MTRNKKILVVLTGAGALTIGNAFLNSASVTPFQAKILKKVTIDTCDYLAEIDTVDCGGTNPKTKA